MLNIFKYKLGLALIPVSSSGVDAMGEMEVLDSDGKLYYHDGSILSAIVTENGTVTLTNKSLKDSSTFIVDASDATIKIAFDAAGTTNTKTTITGSQTANRVITLPDATDTLVGKATTDTLTNKTLTSPIIVSIASGSGTLVINTSGTMTVPNATDTLVGKATTDTLTNKTIAAGSNTISGLTNSNLSGSAGVTGANIASNTVANSNLANMATQTVKGRTTAGTGSPEDLTAAQITALLNSFVGDSGSGGTKGLVPAPATGDAAANKFLKADGAWTALPTTAITSLTGDVTATGPGAAAATVALVGGSSAANVHAAELLANAATSTNTNSAIVKRDGSGNFSATTITATTSLKTATLTDNSAGLAISPTLNQNITISTTGAGRIILQGAEGVDHAEQSGDPSNPSSGYSTLYFKTDHLLYSKDSSGNVRLIGSGGGSAGVNFLTLDTTFVSTKSDNSVFESTVGDWASFATSATVLPSSNPTGGSPGSAVTFTRVTSTPLDGIGSGQLVKDTGNKQGYGASCLINIPPAYRGQNALIEIPYQVTAGSISQGDFKVYIWDVTNSILITPQNNDILGTQGVVKATFPVPASCVQARVFIYIGSTLNGSVTMLIDDVYVGPTTAVFGPAMSDLTQFTMTIEGSSSNPTKGTTSIDAAYWKRVGDEMLINYTYIQTAAGSGAAGSGTYLFKLPSGYLIDSTKTNISTDGNLATVIGSGDFNNSTNKRIGLLVMPYDTSHLFAKYGSSGDYGDPSSNFSSSTPLSGAAVRLSFTARVPIQGWSTNVVSANSQVYRIADYLANGSRVTGAAPTTLGSYRSYLRNASANTFTETNGSPGTAPTAADGILLYNGTAWGTVNPNNKPTKYDIFVGKNKTVRFLFYKSAGRTGFLDATNTINNNNTQIGWSAIYDPTTGVASFVQPSHTTTTSTPVGGTDDTGAFVQADIYADIIVSDNALTVQNYTPQGELYLTGGNGHGSTATKIRRYTTITTNTSTDVSLTQSSTNGDSVTILTTGLYSIIKRDNHSTGGRFGISKNASSLTTNIEDLTDLTQILTLATGGNGLFSETTFVGRLNAGDIIRSQDQGSADATGGAIVTFRIAKIGN
jgi:hypothetical protein